VGGKYLLVNFAGDEKWDYIIGSRLPQTDPAFSEYVDILFFVYRVVEGIR